MDDTCVVTSRVLCALVTVLAQGCFISAAASDFPSRKEYCKWDTFVAECPADHVIIMQEAMYGRMTSSRCIQRNYGYIGCSSNVLPIADVRCSGRHRCEINIPDKEFDRHTNCPEDLRRYLVSRYECIRVITPQFPTCFSSRPVTVHTTKRTTTTPSGYLASVITEKTQCGATDRPWLLDAAPGQQINFTLYNFGAVAARKTSVATETHCRVYAIIKDVDDGKSVTVCAGTKRIRMVYVSSSHVVEVRLLPGNANSTGYFLLHYQVFGCPDLVAPSGGWLKRDGDVVTIGCSQTNERWRLYCRNNTWHGTAIANCSSLATAKRRGGYSTAKEKEFQECLFTLDADVNKTSCNDVVATAIVVIILVALAVGGGILLCGILFMCRMHATEHAAETSVVFGGSQPPRSETSKGDPHFSPYCKATASPGDNAYETVDDTTVGVAPSGESAEDANADYAVTQFLFSPSECRMLQAGPVPQPAGRFHEGRSHCHQYYELEDAGKTADDVIRPGEFAAKPIVSRNV